MNQKKGLLIFFLILISIIIFEYLLSSTDYINNYIKPIVIEDPIIIKPPPPTKKILDKKSTLPKKIITDINLINLYYLDRDKFKSKISNINKTNFKKEVKIAIKYFSIIYNMDPNLIMAMVKKESQFNPKALSNCNAKGLMQLMPLTIKEMGIQDVYNPFENLEGGIKYFKSMLVRFDNKENLALAAYNAGPTAVRKYNGVPPYNETIKYIDTVLRYRKEFYEING